jgi:hypothetical protein
MYITKKELDAICGAIDFIEHNSDGAVDHTVYSEMMDGLRQVREKTKSDHYKRLVKFYLKKTKSSIEA